MARAEAAGGRYLTRQLMVDVTNEPEDETDKDDATPSIFKAVECLTVRPS